jgi:hypothetical protein
MKVTAIGFERIAISKNMFEENEIKVTKTIGETIHFVIAGYNITGTVQGVKEDQSAFIVMGRKDTGGKERKYFVRPVNMI